MTAASVSRALRRDVGIITRPFPTFGYSVHRSVSSDVEASIWVSVSDLDAMNDRYAEQLADELADVYGWKVSRTNSVIYVHYVPGKIESERNAAKFLSDFKVTAPS